MKYKHGKMRGKKAKGNPFAPQNLRPKMGGKRARAKRLANVPL